MKCAILLFVAAVIPLGAQQQEETPIFRTGTLLVQVDVVVHDGKEPVRDLTKDDFQVFDDGQRQEIAVFSLRETQAHAQPVPALSTKGPQYKMNRPSLTGTEPVTATVLLMDRLNTIGDDQVWAQKKTLEYLQRAPLNEYIAIFSLNWQLKQIHELSKDRESLIDAWNSVRAEPQAIDQDGGADAFIKLQRRRDLVTSSFESLSVYLRGLPGRKKLVWISSSLPLFFKQQVGTILTSEQILDMSPELFAAARTLNDANTSLYPVNPKTPLNLADESINTMIKLANITGGKPYYGFSDVDRAIEEAVNDTEVTYTLGFYAPDDKLDQSRKLDVKVARRGVNVRYRRSYTPLIKPQPVEEDRAQRTLDQWLHHPVEATEIPMAAIARRIYGQPGQYVVEVVIDPSVVALEQKEGHWRGVLDLAIAPDVKGKVEGLHQVVRLNLNEKDYVTALTGGITLVNPFKATDGKGALISPQLHIAILDRGTGRVGSVRVPLDLPPQP